MIDGISCASIRLEKSMSETSGSEFFRDCFGNSNFNFTMPKNDDRESVDSLPHYQGTDFDLMLMVAPLLGLDNVDLLTSKYHFQNQV